MIGKLRRRMTLLVMLAVLLVTGGIAASISFANYRGIARQAEETLSALAENGGRRFGAPRRTGDPEGEEEGAAPDGTDARGRVQKGMRPPSGGPGLRGQRLLSAEETVSLSNTFTVLLDEDGAMRAFESDRADLYDEEEISAFALEAAGTGKESGRIGSRFFRRGTRGDTPILVVLDARLEMESARRVTRIAAAAGAAASLVLGLGAWLLVRRMVRPVQEAFDRQRRFVQDAGHEMKTPLAIISSHAQVLEAEGGDSDSLRTIRSEVDRTARLVTQLLTLSKMDRDEVPTKRAPFDAGQAVLEAALSFESTAFEAGMRLRTDEIGEVRALGDAEMTRQLVLILLDNAVKYGDAKEPVSLSLRRRGHSAVLTVENAGADIPPEAIPRLFDRFYRGDAAHGRQKDGSGLGLSIAKSLAGAMGGDIRGESGGGHTRFIVTLALAQNRPAGKGEK